MDENFVKLEDGKCHKVSSINSCLDHPGTEILVDPFGEGEKRQKY